MNAPARAAGWTQVSGPAHAAPLRAVDAIRVSDGPDGLVVEAQFAIPADGEALRGHFPGQPVYPGVFLLESVTQAVAAATGEGPLALAELHSARFLAALRGGEALTVTATVTAADAAGHRRVIATCRHADGAVAADLRVTLTSAAVPEPSRA